MQIRGKSGLDKPISLCYYRDVHRGVAQLAEQRSPKAKVAGSIPATPVLKTPENSQASSSV